MPTALVSIVDREPAIGVGASAGGLHAVVLDVCAATLSIDDVRRFAELQVETHRRQASVPIRVGTIYADRDGAEDHLHRSAIRYRHLLDQVGDCVEYTIRPEKVIGTSSGDPEGAACRQGRSYLETRRNQDLVKRGIDVGFDRFVRLDLKPLVEIAAAYHLEPARTQDTQPAIAFLVPRATDAAFLQRFDSLGSAAGLSLTGPWPPSTFVSSDAVPAAA